MINPYESCPVYETGSFILRFVEMSDAGDLLFCYSDLKSVKFMNADRCTSNFYYKTFDEMKSCISMWIDEYKNKGFVRFSIIDKSINKAVGTIEMFGCNDVKDSSQDWGILRIDLASQYEKTDLISELLEIATNNFYDVFNVKNIITKAIAEAVERRDALRRYGFCIMTDTQKVPNIKLNNNYFIRSKFNTLSFNIELTKSKSYSLQ